MEGKNELKVVLRPPRVCLGTPNTPAPNIHTIIMIIIVKLFNVKYIVGVGEMAQWRKHLLCKHGIG